MLLAEAWTNHDAIMLSVKFFGCIIGVFLFLCFMGGLLNPEVKPLKIPDRFDIGYVDDPEPQVIYVEVEKAPKPKKKQPKKVVPKQTAKKSCPADDQLRQDCVDALVSLGTKKGEARRVAAQCLAQNPHIKTVQEFIPEVFKRGNA